MKGTVMFYNVRKAFGFILGEDGRKYFVHKTSIPFWTIYLNKGDVVDFTPTESNRGATATDVSMR